MPTAVEKFASSLTMKETAAIERRLRFNLTHIGDPAFPMADFQVAIAVAAKKHAGDTKFSHADAERMNIDELATALTEAFKTLGLEDDVVVDDDADFPESEPSDEPPSASQPESSQASTTN